MTSHAVVHFDRDGITRREEVVSPPQVLEDGTAESMWAALGRQIPLHQLLDADLAALLCSPDSAKANVRLMGHMFALLPDNVLAMFLGCMHHQLGLVITPVTKELNMLCPAFCTAKQMQNGVLLSGMEDALLDIRVHQGWRPRPCRHRVRREGSREYDLQEERWRARAQRRRDRRNREGRQSAPQGGQGHLLHD